MLSAMSQGALVLREVSSHVWREFADGPSQNGGACAGSSHLVVDHWQRSRSLGASLDGPPDEEYLVRGEPLKMLSERTEVVQHVAATDFERAAVDVAARSYVMILADPSGVVVRTSGGGGFASDAERLRLISGADWSEKSRGTNAIGTAIAEQRPVYVRGNAHFARSYHELVCYAAPVFDADGSLVAILDATSWFAGVDDAIGEAVIRTAGAITQSLRDHAFGQAGRAVTRTLARALDRMEGIVLLLEHPARVTRMNTGAKILLGDRTGQRVDKVLGVDMPMLMAEARDPRGLTLEFEGRAHRVRLDPIETAEGKLIAILAFLEPQGQILLGSGSSPPSSRVFEQVFSRDPRLDAAMVLAGQLADTGMPVLLSGESGTGKELLARSIHEASTRREREFVVVDCEVLTRALQEVEVFGYGPSAFPSAAPGSSRSGLISKAAEGTLFFDEVAELSSQAQATLLRLLEHGTYRRLGEVTLLRADVRVVMATRQDLAAMVAAGAFRHDLYHFVKKAEIGLPPLRVRADRTALIVHLLEKAGQASGTGGVYSLAPATLALLERYSWPGNVRELRSVLGVSVARSGADRIILPEHLPAEFGSTSPPSDSMTKTADLEIAERATVRRVLAEVEGNVSVAAKRLGVARSTLYRMMRRHGLVPC
jgi:transcriptional regulator of acetoin/glycerol metabolism